MKQVMMAWYDNAARVGPLTYRTYDGRRKARYLDILSLFNRINISHLRISQLEGLRREQTKERVAFRQASHVKPSLRLGRPVTEKNVIETFVLLSSTW